MNTHTSPHKNFTTTLPDPMLRAVGDAAKELGVQKKDVLIQAFEYWSKRRRQEKLAESYRRVKGKDKDELIALADEGLEEWANNIP